MLRWLAFLMQSRRTVTGYEGYTPHNHYMQRARFARR